MFSRWVRRRCARGPTQQETEDSQARMVHAEQMWAEFCVQHGIVLSSNQEE